MNLEADLKFPLRDDDWAVKVLIGGLISIIPIVNLIALGYYLKTMKRTIRETPGMPPWKHLGSLFVKGLGSVVIALVYMLVPIIVATGAAVVWGLGAASGLFLSPWVIFAETSLVLGLLLAGVLAVIFGFFLPMALATYADTGRLGSAFHFRPVLNRIRSVSHDYLVTYLVVVVLSIALSVVSMVPVVGWIVALFGGFYVGIVAANMFGRVYAASSP